MSTLATFNWKPAANGWFYDRLTLEGVEVTLIRRGRTCAILLPGLCEYFGATRNRMSVTNYQKKVGPMIATCHVGYGVSKSSAGGKVKAVFTSTLKAALAAVNIKPDAERLEKLLAVMTQAQRPIKQADPAEEAVESAVGNGWVNGDEAKWMWLQALKRLAILDLPLAKLLQATTTVFAYSPKVGTVNLMGSAQALALLWKDQGKQARIEQAISDVTGMTTPGIQVNFYAGTLGRGPLSHLDGSAAQPLLLPRTADYMQPDDADDEVPFDGPVYEEPEEGVITSDDILLDTSARTHEIAQNVRDLADDLGGLESKLDRYATLVARRNLMLAAILESVAEVLRANLCTPDEAPAGRYKEQGATNA